MYLVIKSCLQLLKMNVSFLNGSQVASFNESRGKVGRTHPENLDNKKKQQQTKKVKSLQADGPTKNQTDQQTDRRTIGI